MTKRDPYKHEERYKKWKENVSKKGVQDVSEANSDLIIKYVTDMEYGFNVSSKSAKGGRSFIRLNSLVEKMTFFSKRFFDEYKIEDLSKLDEETTVMFFARMRSGEIEKLKGGKYKGIENFAKTFKAFWHWWQTVNRKKDIAIKDISISM